MSTEVEQQPTGAVVTEKAVIVEENGSAPATETTTVQNGDSKKEDKNGTVKKEPEPPKDFKTQTTEWLNEQNKTIVHKVNKCNIFLNTFLGWILRPSVGCQ
jgi:hypothetical protein